MLCQKTNTMSHIMSLKNTISCVVGISIFRFRNYWKIFFDFLDLNMSSTFKQFLQAETVNAKKNKA